MADLIAMLSAAAGASAGGINPREHFNTVLYTGTLSTPNAISGVGFAPDFIWFKSRTQAYNNYLFNKITSGSNFLLSNAPNAEGTTGDSISFDSDGFTITAGSALNDTFGSPNNMVAWNWKANGAGSSNTDGTITSTVSVNTTSGFSICTYTGTGSAGTVGHGLGVAPKIIFVKNRTTTNNWAVNVYNILGSTNNSLWLNLTNAVADVNTWWNSTAPTSTVFSIGGVTNETNTSTDTFVAYCFAQIPGYSAFGSYTGNGSATGPSVTTDFEPTWLMIKRTDTTGDWILLDSARDTANPRDKYLEPNTADAEATGNDVDFNATGFQLKSTSASINASGGTYIYACFA